METLVKRIRSQVDNNQAVKTLRKGEYKEKDYGLLQKIDSLKQEKSSDHSSLQITRSASPKILDSTAQSFSST